MTTITVEDMSCEHCEQTFAEALQDVTDVNVDREDEQASVNGDTDILALVGAVKDAGYDCTRLRRTRGTRDADQYAVFP